jgi:hypothetical protein
MCKFVFLSALIILTVFSACDPKDSKPDNSNPGDSNPDGSGNKTHTISFNANGGTRGQTATVTATVGQAMPALTSAPPSKIENVAATFDNRAYTGFNKEFYFDGYFDSPTGGTKYYNTDLSSAKNWDKEDDATLHAQWTSIESKYGITLTAFDYTARFTETAPVIDGNGSDTVWEKAQWKPIDQVWITPTGTTFPTPPTPENFTGRYKMLWTAEKLYYLVEITDNIKSVTRQITNPYNEPYEDDCLELFINEDGQGGSHLANNNAFAYHMCFDGESAMDYVSPASGAGFQGGYIKRNHHMTYKIGEAAAPVYIWEVALKVYDKNCPINDNPDSQPPAVPVTLTDGKMMRFAIAYNDSDNGSTPNKREYFMGSVFVSDANANARNQAYLTADVFSKLYLVK